MVLAKLRQCIELEGAGYSRNLDRRTRREVMLNSIVVRVELALSKWSDRKSCGNELDRAEELLDAARPYSRNFDPSPEGSAGADSPALTDTEVDWSADSVCVVDPEFELLSEDVRLLRHHWRKRTPQWWQILLAAVIACGGIPWLFQGGWSIFWTLIATTSLVFAALVAMSPWVRKWSFHGLEFSRDELSVAPSVAAGVEPDALRAILRTELMSSLQSRLWSSMASITTRDVDLPKRTAEVDEAAFEQPSKRGVKAMGTESLRLRGRPNG